MGLAANISFRSVALSVERVKVLLKSLIRRDAGIREVRASFCDEMSVAAVQVDASFQRTASTRRFATCFG